MRYEALIKNPEHFSRYHARYTPTNSAIGVSCSHCSANTTQHYITARPYNVSLCMPCYDHCRALFEWTSKTKVGPNVGPAHGRVNIHGRNLRSSNRNLNLVMAPSMTEFRNEVSGVSSTKRKREKSEESSTDEDGVADDEDEAKGKEKKAKVADKPPSVSHVLKTLNDYVDTLPSRTSTVLSKTLSTSSLALNRKPFEIKTVTGKKIYVGRNHQNFEKVSDVMAQISAQELIPVQHQRLIFNGKYVEPSKLLSEIGAEDGGVFGLVLNTPPENS